MGYCLLCHLSGGLSPFPMPGLKPESRAIRRSKPAAALFLSRGILRRSFSLLSRRRSSRPWMRCCEGRLRPRHNRGFPHSQFLHQADRLYGINGFRENLVDFAFAESIVNQGATGFKGIALPPEAAIQWTKDTLSWKQYLSRQQQLYICLLYKEYTIRVSLYLSSLHHIP